MSVLKRVSLRRVKRELTRTRRSEDGSLTLLTLFIFVVMLLIAGMAVDLMRFETRRTALQNTIDSAVLAATNLNQEADSETLVEDFFAKSGYDPSKVRITATEDWIGGDADGVGGTRVGRVVSAEADLGMSTFFMHLLGIDTLNGVSAGQAEESVEGVEISMILDISGSMRGDKIADLKVAAKNFLSIVLDDEANPSGAAKTSVSIVPYNANVVVPDALLDRLNTQATVPVTAAITHYADPADFPGAMTVFEREAPNSRCVLFTDDQLVTADLDGDYEALRAIGPATPLTRLGYFDEGGKSAGSGGDYDRPDDLSNRFCDPTRSSIVVHETRKSVLETAIDAMTAGGWTSIDNGMKWGVALLDPAMRPVVNSMVDANLLEETVRNRPDNYQDGATMKVVVLMTDGANTLQRDLQAGYRVGPSPVWFSPALAGEDFDTAVIPTGSSYWDGFFVRLDDTGPGYWYQGQEPWDRNDGVYYDEDGLPADAVQLSYAALYDRFSENAVADLFRDRSDDDDDRLDDLYNAHRTAVYEPNLLW